MSKLKVKFCPFCGFDTVIIDCYPEVLTPGISLPPLYQCQGCGEYFVASQDVDKISNAFCKTNKTLETCTDDKDECVGPASDWYEQRYYETLRELEKTRYLLDLTIKEGMRRE